MSLRPPGSSPRVRGTQVEARLQWHPYRFIPACTGNSIPRGSLDMAAAVHPRVYGELPGPGGTGIPAGGSSPRVRGTPRLIPRRGRAWRFIPACTGNSVSLKECSPRRSVHPRVYGELAVLGRHPRQRDGSSPRVRGTQAATGCCGVFARFIPACTGNSLLVGTTRTERTVHPRVYGELIHNDVQATDDHGSSPRVRGTRHRPRRSLRPPRFIPACTGNSVVAVKPIRTAAVHPRVYGELSVNDIPSKPTTGSSPRVRGTP